MTLDPNRTYSAGEVQAFLDRQTLTEVREDLGKVMTLAKETAEGLSRLEAAVTRLVATDQEMGFTSMSPTERAAVTPMVRAYQAGQQSVQHREKFWRRVAGAAMLVFGSTSVFSVFGLASWVRVHWLGLPP